MSIIVSLFSSVAAGRNHRLRASGVDQRDQRIGVVALITDDRHVHEYNGGEVDVRYIKETGDQSVKPKQLIRESRESVLDTIKAVETMTENFHKQFHEIFPPDPKPISYHRPRSMD